MKYSVVIALSVSLLLGAGMGCARAARDTSGFAVREQTVIDAPFEETWHAVKRALRDEGFDLHTRDKRGRFVAYSPMRRVFFTQPRRTKFTIDMARTAPEETAISVESVRQIYGVTLLTHPNWHDREQRDPGASQAVIDAIRLALEEAPEEAEPFIEEDVDVPEAPPEEVPAEIEPRPEIEERPLPADQLPTIGDAETVE